MTQKIDQASKVCLKTLALIWNAREKATAAADKACLKAKTVAQETYNKETATTLKIFEATLAQELRDQAKKEEKA